MKIFIFPNTTAQRYIDRLHKALANLQADNECSLNEEDCLRIFGNTDLVSFGVEDCEAIVSLGGDGTFLRAVQLALQNDKPVYGINCGRVGYLCRHNDHDDYDLSNLKCEEFALLEFENNGRTYYALNDVVAGKDYFGGTVELGLSVAGQRIYDFWGDGIIVSTPIGSTGYNRSAGGKILDACDRKLAITPVCPTDQNIRQLIVADDCTVTIDSLSSLYSSSVFADGQYAGVLDQLKVFLSKRKVKILK